MSASDDGGELTFPKNKAPKEPIQSAKGEDHKIISADYGPEDPNDFSHWRELENAIATALVGKDAEIEHWKGMVNTSIAAHRQERDTLRAELSGMTENRNHFCHHINLIAAEFGTNKDNSSPEAVLRWVQDLRAEVERLKAEALVADQVAKSNSTYNQSLQTELDRLKARRMPVRNAPSIAWDLIEPHEQQAKENHGGQSLQRLAERGGLSACEAVAILEDRRCTRMEDSAALARLKQIVESDLQTELDEALRLIGLFMAPYFIQQKRMEYSDAAKKWFKEMPDKWPMASVGAEMTMGECRKAAELLSRHTARKGTHGSEQASNPEAVTELAGSDTTNLVDLVARQGGVK